MNASHKCTTDSLAVDFMWCLVTEARMILQRRTGISGQIHSGKTSRFRRFQAAGNIDHEDRGHAGCRGDQPGFRLADRAGCVPG